MVGGLLKSAEHAYFPASIVGKSPGNEVLRGYVPVRKNVLEELIHIIEEIHGIIAELKGEALSRNFTA